MGKPGPQRRLYDGFVNIDGAGRWFLHMGTVVYGTGSTSPRAWMKHWLGRPKTPIYSLAPRKLKA